MFDTLSFSATDKVAFVTKSNDASFVTKAKEVGSEVNVYSTAADVLALQGGEFTKIVVDQESAEEFLNLGGLAKVAKFLAGGGEISIARADGNEKLDTKFLLGGYVEVSESKVEAPAENASVIWSAKIPKYEAAAKLLPKKKKEEGKSANAVWKLMANDFDDNAYELENEDDLLKGDEAPKPSSSAAAECGPNSGKKRACKNCSCGLKDMEGEPVVSEAELEKSISGCGNCAKGDAFRCGGCPYLGLPTFTPGTKPEIVVKEDGAKVLVDMTSDI